MANSTLHANAGEEFFRCCPLPRFPSLVPERFDSRQSVYHAARLPTSLTNSENLHSCKSFFFYFIPRVTHFPYNLKENGRYAHTQGDKKKKNGKKRKSKMNPLNGRDRERKKNRQTRPVKNFEVCRQTRQPTRDANKKGRRRCLIKKMREWKGRWASCWKKTNLTGTNKSPKSESNF